MLINDVELTSPILLFTYQFTSWLDLNVVENPPSGIGHSGNAVIGVTSVTGPFVGPIFIVDVDQFPNPPSQSTGRT